MWQSVAIATTLATGIVTIAAWSVSTYTETKTIKDDVLRSLPAAIANNKEYASIVPSTTYVNRQDLENEVRAWFVDQGIWLYRNVWCQGSGQVRSRGAWSRDCQVTVSSASTKEDVVSALLKAIVGVEDRSINADLLNKDIQKCQHKPTIIFDTVQAVRSLAKLLAQSCAVIIILSEANAISEFG